MSEEPRYFRRVRSFVRREGRMTKGQLRAMAELFPLYGVDLAATPCINEQAWFSQAPLHVEIGFGNGHALTHMAAAQPSHHYLGIEVHRPGVGNALLQIEKQGLSNVRVVCHDAVEVLTSHIADASLAAVYIFFPDPWHKKRHHKRRLIQPDFIQLLHTKLQVKAHLHFATDWQNYAQHMVQVMKQAPGFRNLAASDDYIPRPEYRPLTKFEQRGLRLGHGVWDLLYEKI